MSYNVRRGTSSEVGRVRKQKLKHNENAARDGALYGSVYDDSPVESNLENVHTT
jgi:hypothetical protein